MGIYIFIGIGALLFIYILITYIAFIQLSNKVKEAFATMDVYLKKRWDLIPNIVETVKGYVKHERDTLENIVKLRNTIYENMSLDAKIDTNEKLTTGISKLMMLAENYPDLKANHNFLDLSSQLTKVEEDIANSRKYYNAVIRNLNDRVQMFPSNILANLFRFKAMNFFEMNEPERERVEVKL